jgi:D-3-phosphoglycerate dehydrogenase / 2-oxoglutarate reductase
VRGRHKVVVIDDWDGIAKRSPALESLSSEVDLLVYGDKAEGDELVRRLKDADVVVPFRERTPFDASLLGRLPGLRLIAQTGGGAAHIDLDRARELGVQVALTPGASAVSVAELCLGLMLVLYRRINEGDAGIKNGAWPELLGKELAGRRLGIAGFGETAQALAPRAAALGMRIVAWSRSLTKGHAPQYVRVASSLEELASESDTLSLHLSLTPETRNLVTYKHFELMPPGAVLINTARGQLVPEHDLIRALEEGLLAGAALDVYATEPPPADSRLRRLPNVVLTPHTGWRTMEAQERYLEGVAENIRAFLSSTACQRDEQ